MKAALLLLMSAVASLPAAPAANHARAEHEHSFEVALPAAEAFGLFEPVGEKRWAEGWQPVFATPEDARLHNGTVFIVDRPAAAGSHPLQTVWTITRYEPARLIEYHNVLVGIRATRITVSLDAAGDGRTRVTVRYAYTGLSEAGDQAIRAITRDSYGAMIDSWGADIAAYLRRGTPASP